MNLHCHILEDVITNNKTREDIISISYGEIKTSDVNEIATIKTKLEDNTKYEVSLDYDEYGYVNNINIR